LGEYWYGDYARRTIYEFLESTEMQAIFIKESKGSIEIFDRPVKSAKSGIFYILKLEKRPLSEESIAREVIYGDISSDPLDHVSTLAERIFNPIVGSKECSQAWSETVVKEIREYFEAFIANIQITQGHMKGVTCLPLPNSGGAAADGKGIEEDFASKTPQEQFKRIHELESAIITWTKQIKNVLKQDPESVFLNQVNPGNSRFNR